MTTYNDSLEKARKAYQSYKDTYNSIEDKKSNAALMLLGSISALEEQYPELKENEDEEIRKELISFFTERAKYTEDSTFNGLSSKEIIAWLEKQGEQKSTQETEPTPIFRIGDVLKRKGKGYTFIVDRIQGGYYHCDHNNGAFFPIEEQGNWELVELKPTDEEMKELLRTEYEKGRADAIAEMQKPWSEEDEHRIKLLKALCEDKLLESLPNSTMYEEMKITIDWLKLLIPQTTWKPSEEQMEALKMAVGMLGEHSFSDVLDNLLTDLKELKG